MITYYVDTAVFPVQNTKSYMSGDGLIYLTVYSNSTGVPSIFYFYSVDVNKPTLITSIPDIIGGGKRWVYNCTLNYDGTVMSYTIGVYDGSNYICQNRTCDRVGNTWIHRTPTLPIVYYSTVPSITISDDGNTLAVGELAYSDVWEKQGRVLIYKRNENDWVLQQIITAPAAINSHELYFGEGISFNGDGTKLLIGAPGYRKIGMLLSYSYTTNWELQSTYTYPTYMAEEWLPGVGRAVFVNSTFTRALFLRYRASYNAGYSMITNTNGVWGNTEDFADNSDFSVLCFFENENLLVQRGSSVSIAMRNLPIIQGNILQGGVPMDCKIELYNVLGGYLASTTSSAVDGSFTITSAVLSDVSLIIKSKSTLYNDKIYKMNPGYL